MAEETLADVLSTQDGPETVPEDNAEVSEVPAENAGEQPDPPADAHEGNEEAEDKPKRLGGWQRKIAKLTEQNEMLMEMLQSKKAEAPSETPKPTTKPKRPEISTFQGTVEQFEQALDKHEEDLGRWRDEQNQQQEQQRQMSELSGSFNQRVTEMPEFDQMREAASGMSDRLVNFMQAQLAKLKNGPEVLREAVLDEETKDQLIRLDKLSDGAAIQSQLHAIATALRIASRKSGVQKTAPVSSAPEPVKPVKKPAPVSNKPEDAETFMEFKRRREAQIKARQ